MIGWSGLEWSSFAMSMASKSTLILCAACVLAWALRGRSAAARHLVWTAAAAAVLALPFLSVSLPSLRVPASHSMLPGNTGLVFQVFGLATAEPATGPSVAAGSAGSSGNNAARRLDARWWLADIWAFGAAVMLANMLAASLALWRLRRRARPYRGSDLTAARGVRILETDANTMPMAFGLLRPTVLMPAVSAAWSEERRWVVLLHELAHIRRGDIVTQVLARVALSLHWWNPLAWHAWREFLKERERAADDLVLQAGARAADYAGHLLDVARTMQNAGAWGAVAMARRSQLEGRLLAILDSGVNRGGVGRKAPALAALAAVLLVAPFAAMRAQEQAGAAAMPEIDATIRAANAQKNHEILERAATVYENLGKDAVAQKLLESALAIRGEVSGQQSAAYAAGLVKLGDLAVKRRQMGEADAFYRKAVALGDRPEVAGALIFLGRIAQATRDFNQAMDLFQRAVNVGPGAPEAAVALRWMATVRSLQDGGAAETESLYQRALAIAQPDAQIATTLDLYALYLKRQGRDQEAQPIEARLKTLRRELIDKLTESTAAQPTSTALRVGNGVTSPKVLFKREPDYTEEARQAKFQGTVLLYIEVGTDGLAHNMKVQRSLGMGLDEKAIESVSRWQFQPGTKDGLPVTVAATIEINFRLL